MTADGTAQVLSNDTQLISPQGMMVYQNQIIVVNGNNDLLLVSWPSAQSAASLTSIAPSPLYNNAQGIALSPDGTTFLLG
jgi:hypothetical protein